MGFSMMYNELLKAISKFYHDLSIGELKLQHKLQDSTKLTYNDVLYLDIISAHSGKYTSTQLADMLHVSRPSVTKKIKELIKKGYVTRKQSNTDKRMYYLFVNESIYFQYSGENLGRKIMKIIDGKYTDKDIHNLCELLNLISNTLSEDNANDDIQ